ncbi:MAG: homoserine O-acetyltransferase MetX [Miltoncostaeaceae bacterium]
MGTSESTSLGRVETRIVRVAGPERPLRLESGETLGRLDVAYETYGELNADRSNAVVVCHALTGDANAAGHHGDPQRPGWWDTIIGPGKAVDTERYHVVSSNLLGGCAGTTGPSSDDPATGAPYGLRFPSFTVRDLVTVHRLLLAELGIERPLAAMGGSLGGMQVLQWGLDHPSELGAGLVICASSRLTDQNIAFSTVGRHAIMSDPDFQDGDYYGSGRAPARGLAVARMMAHITYLSQEGMSRKFGREVREGRDARDLGPAFEVESYLHHQGERFVRRFDANTYLYLSRVMDIFEPFDDPSVPDDVSGNGTAFHVVSFDSDWRFDTTQSLEIVRNLEKRGADVRFAEISTHWGHDAFLLPLPELHRLVQDALAEAAGALGR